MLWNVFHVSWLNLKRDRVAQLLSFVLPVVVFTIFAIMFGGVGGGATSRVQIAVLDLDQSAGSRRLVAALEKDDGLSVSSVPAAQPGNAPTRDDALRLVKNAKVPVALVIPRDFGKSFPSFGGGGVEIELLADKSDPIAHQMVGGLLQRAAMTAAPDLMMERGLKLFEQYGGAFTPLQSQAVANIRQLMQHDDETASTKSAAAQADAANANSAPGDRAKRITSGFTNPVPFKVVDVLGDVDKTPTIAYLAAGTAVMFLLFSTSGAGGVILEEEESGTLERLLSSKARMTTLLLGKWLFIAAMGVVQVVVMFAWGALFFGLKLWTPTHLVGFATMTIATAAAASAFGLILATASRSRGQLSGLSTLLILTMSALGGSMIPRYVMNDTMKSLGYLTFNAWALDGYRDVFWYEKGPLELWPYLLVLSAITIVFLFIARWLARRWETV
ncbi:MAG: ABC transporter permease [Phycisphaerae bacterium]